MFAVLFIDWFIIDVSIVICDFLTGNNAEVNDILSSIRESLMIGMQQKEQFQRQLSSVSTQPMARRRSQGDVRVKCEFEGEKRYVANM